MVTLKLRPIVISFILLFASTAISQDPCVEFKHFEFFVPVDAKVPNWSEKQVSEILTQSASRESRFFIPFIVKQLADYEPACGKLGVDRRFGLLVKLYSVIRKDSRVTAERPARETLQMMRKDFYKQIDDDRLFSDLIYTMDDGPMMGKIVSVSSIKPLNSREFATPFGKIRFANIRGGVAVLAIDKYGKSLWSRTLEGVPKRALREADLKTLTVEETTFVVVARLVVDGERLTLYTRPNGRFMYYRHSW